MSISMCPQPSGRLLALWLFAKHQQGGWRRRIWVSTRLSMTCMLEEL